MRLFDFKYLEAHCGGKIGVMLYRYVEEKRKEVFNKLVKRVKQEG